MNIARGGMHGANASSEREAAPGGAAAAGLRIGLLGPFEVRLGAAPLPRLRARSDQWLLALLALRQGAAVQRRWLAGTLWPASEEGLALANLRRGLNSLRRALGPFGAALRSPGPGALCLDRTGAFVDAVAF